MIGRNSAISSASPPKPPSKSNRNAPHPTTRKRPRETLRPFAPAPRHLASLVVADAFAGELTRGSFKTFPASEETTNTQRFEADSLAERPGFEPGLTESESFIRIRLTGTQMFNRLPALLKTEPGRHFAHLTLCSAIREAPRSR